MEALRKQVDAPSPGLVEMTLLRTAESLLTPGAPKSINIVTLLDLNAFLTALTIFDRLYVLAPDHESIEAMNNLLEEAVIVPLELSTESKELVHITLSAMANYFRYPRDRYDTCAHMLAIWNDTLGRALNAGADRFEWDELDLGPASPVAILYSLEKLFDTRWREPDLAEFRRFISLSTFRSQFTLWLSGITRAQYLPSVLRTPVVDYLFRQAQVRDAVSRSLLESRLHFESALEMVRYCQGLIRSENLNSVNTLYRFEFPLLLSVVLRRVADKDWDIGKSVRKLRRDSVSFRRWLHKATLAAKRGDPFALNSVMESVEHGFASKAGDTVTTISGEIMSFIPAGHLNKMAIRTLSRIALERPAFQSTMARILNRLFQPHVYFLQRVYWDAKGFQSLEGAVSQVWPDTQLSAKDRDIYEALCSKQAILNLRPTS